MPIQYKQSITMGILKKIKHGAHHATHNPPSIPTPNLPHINIPIPPIDPPKPVHIPVPAPINHIAHESQHKANKIIDTTTDIGSSSDKKHHSGNKDAIVDPTPDEGTWWIYAIGIGVAGLIFIL